LAALPAASSLPLGPLLSLLPAFPRSVLGLGRAVSGPLAVGASLPCFGRAVVGPGLVADRDDDKGGWIVAGAKGGHLPHEEGGLPSRKLDNLVARRLQACCAGELEEEHRRFRGSNGNGRRLIARERRSGQCEGKRLAPRRSERRPDNVDFWFSGVAPIFLPLGNERDLVDAGRILLPPDERARLPAGEKDRLTIGESGEHLAGWAAQLDGRAVGHDEAKRERLDYQPRAARHVDATHGPRHLATRELGRALRDDLSRRAFRLATVVLVLEQRHGRWNRQHGCWRKEDRDGDQDDQGLSARLRPRAATRLRSSFGR
jgi:hypothetical protein